MPIYKIRKEDLAPINETKINLEKDLQKLTEKNLEVVFGYKFVSSEFQLNGLRIDTLAFDPETKAFVIIEYKRDKSFSVIDQGFSYLSQMLNNKAEFILEYSEKLNSKLERSDVDWSQSKVLFLANSFTTYQQNAINFRDLPMELWVVKKFSNDTIFYEKIQTADGSESINKISGNKTIEKVSNEVKKYTVDDHFKEGWESRDLYDALSERILEIDNRIFINPVKSYIGFRIDNNYNIALIHVRKTVLMLDIPRTKPGDLKDPRGRAKLKKNSLKYFGQHITEMEIKNEDDIEYAVYLMEQRYKEIYK